MSDHCECCGVKYTGEVCLQPHETINGNMDPNFKWVVEEHFKASGKICLWCAGILPGWVIDIAVDHNYIWKEYNFQNFKLYPALAERIKSIFNCPRCKTVMGKTESIDPFPGEKEMINKCFNCGYC